MSLTRHDTVDTWATAARAEGFPQEPGCLFYAWADQAPDAPLTALEGAPQDAILAACVVGLRLSVCADRDFFIGLLDAHSNSAAVKRWARNG
jgi:hypothetical protein